MYEKNFLKTTTALAFAALVATSSLMVYGAGNYTLKVNHTDYVDLHEQYNIKPQNFMRVFYDYGTTNPYDDARATTEMNSTSKLSVTAKVYLTDNAGHERSSGNNEQGSTSPVHSGEAYLSGIDYAKYVKHEGYKKEIGTKVADGYVYRYRQVK